MLTRAMILALTLTVQVQGLLYICLGFSYCLNFLICNLLAGHNLKHEIIEEVRDKGTPTKYSQFHD